VSRGGTIMISESDIWAAALLMVKRYGDDAGNQAAMRANAMASEGDDDGCVVWVQIAKAIEKVQAIAPADGQAVH